MIPDHVRIAVHVSSSPKVSLPVCVPRGSLQIRDKRGVVTLGSRDESQEDKLD
jgi:hypothetical protein